MNKLVLKPLTGVQADMVLVLEEDGTAHALVHRDIFWKKDGRTLLYERLCKGETVTVEVHVAE